jgi:hypothetical protein
VWQLGKEQRLLCPTEFQDRVTEAGGVNKYDEPNFKITWMGTETMRAGGVWENPDIPGIEHYSGYRDVLADVEGEGWAIRQWMPAEFFGTPTAWYVQNYDESCGMQILGGYPYSGAYVTIFPLVCHTEVNGEQVTECMPLSSYLIDVVIPIVVMAKQITEAQKRAVIAERKAREEEGKVSQIEDSLRNAFPALGEIRSAAGLSCLSVVQKKMEQIEQHWNSGIQFFHQRAKGLSVN